MDPLTHQQQSSTEPLGKLSTTEAGAQAAERLKAALADNGFSPEALKKLTKGERGDIAEVAARSSTNLVVMRRMVNAVGSEDADMLKKLVNLMKNYHHRFDVLGKLLDVMGTDNPFAATANSEVRILMAEPKALKESIEVKIQTSEQTTSIRASRLRSRLVIGATGQELTGTVYCVYNPSSPNGETFQSGITAFRGIFSTFCPERISIEKRRSTNDRRAATLRAELRNLTVEDLVEDPSLADESGSRLIVRNLEVYRALREAITECKRRIGELTYTGSMLLSGAESLRVAADPGGQLMRWFEEHIRENENVPKGIVLAYQEISDPDVKLSPEEEKNYLRGMVAYQRNNTYISKSLVLSGILSDLAVHQSLPAEDPLRLDSAVETARKQVSEEISRAESDMPLSEFGRYLALSGMAEFRETMNRRVLDTYRDEFNKALELFKFVSFDGTKWRDDLDGESVPMTRLRQHLYGSKLGHKQQAVLQQKDFKHVVEAQRLLHLIPDEGRALNVLPVAKFKAMVEGVVVAYRKARYIDHALEQHLCSPEGATITLDRTNVGESLASWKASFPYGSAFQLQETRTSSLQNDRLGRPLSIAEIADRYLDQVETISSSRSDTLRQQLTKWSFEIRQLAPFGLYSPETEPFWERAERKVQDLIPSSECEELLNRAVAIITNPLVEDPGLVRSRTGASKYMWQHSINIAKLVVAHESQISEASDALRAQLPQLAERYKELSRSGTIYVGGVQQNEHGKDAPHLRWLPIAEHLGEVVVEDEGTGTKFTYCNARRLSDALLQLETGFIRGDQVDRKWIQDAKRICSFSGARELSEQGMAIVDRETFLCVKNLSIGRHDYVSRDFYELINKVVNQ